jgi:hypothetical protein
VTERFVKHGGSVKFVARFILFMPSRYQLKLHDNLIKLGRFADNCILRHRVLGLKPLPKEVRQPAIEKNPLNEHAVGNHQSCQPCFCANQEAKSPSKTLGLEAVAEKYLPEASIDMPSLQTITNCQFCRKSKSKLNIASDMEGDDVDEETVKSYSDSSSLQGSGSTSDSNSERDMDDLFDEPERSIQEEQHATVEAQALDMPAL